MVKTIAASFDGHPAARRAVRKLTDDGYMSCDIGFMASDASGNSRVDGEGNPLMIGAGAGAVAGGLIGALTEAGVPDEHAEYYAEALRRGGALVTVKVDDSRADRAAEIMRANGAIGLDDLVLRWREAGWEGWNTASLPYTAEEAERERRLYGAHADPLTGLPQTSDPEGDNCRDSTIRR